MCKPTRRETIQAAATLVAEARDRLRASENILRVAGESDLAGLAHANGSGVAAFAERLLEIRDAEPVA